ncbi:uncharacterized protein STAUR_2306 [Stigmatella aurantiaca DW4/3-1]|nr:uncharacterized protein STAUR_2306 [Stigmatella aurantiaca DW4/3-1]
MHVRLFSKPNTSRRQGKIRPGNYLRPGVNPRINAPRAEGAEVIPRAVLRGKNAREGCFSASGVLLRPHGSRLFMP